MYIYICQEVALQELIILMVMKTTMNAANSNFNVLDMFYTEDNTFVPSMSAQKLS